MFPTASGGLYSLFSIDVISCFSIDPRVLCAARRRHFQFHEIFGHVPKISYLTAASVSVGTWHERTRLHGGVHEGDGMTANKMSRNKSPSCYNYITRHCGNQSFFVVYSSCLWRGTFPHVVDPQTPGAVDTIIHLGDCWRKEDIVPHKHDIIHYNRQIGGYFASAYRYLAAAAQIYLDTAVCSAPYAKPVAQKTLHQLVETYIKPLAPTGRSEGFLRKLFLTAITPAGILCHVPSFAGATTCVLEGDGFVTAEILQTLCKEYLAKGYDVEAFYSPLNPDTQIDHLYIPALSLLFATHDTVNQFPLPQGAVSLPMELSLPEDIAATVTQNNALLRQLLDTSVQTIRKAKATHDLLETCYVPHMDFGKVEEIKDSILSALPLD